MQKSQFGIIIVAVVALMLSMSLFVVDEREYAIKFRLGKIEKSDYTPGIHFKIPFYNDVKKFDKRLQNVTLEAEQFLTAETKYMIVDSFVKWRIDDVRIFFTDTAGSLVQANNRLLTIINTALKEAIANHTIQEAISDKRDAIMRRVQKEVNSKAHQLGIAVTDVRIKRLDFPNNVRVDVFNRMIKGREKEARQIRSTGAEQAKVIRAGADRTRQELLAEAYRESESQRGAGDAKAAEIYAQAYGKDAEFYRFTRSLRAYTDSFGERQDVLVLEPDSEFFRYFNDATGSKIK